MVRVNIGKFNNVVLNDGVHLNLGDQPRSRPLDLRGNLFGKDDEGTRKEDDRVEQWEPSSNTPRDGQKGHQTEREMVSSRE